MAGESVMENARTVLIIFIWQYTLPQLSSGLDYIYLISVGRY